MSLARFAFYVLWLMPVPLLALAAVVMRMHRLHRQFPAFFAYCAFSAVQTPILLLVFHRTTAYFYCYWVAEAVGAVLGLAAIYEVFLSIFQRADGNQRLAQSLFRWVGAALVLAAVAAAIAAPGNDEHWLMAASLVVDRSVRLVQCGLLFFLFLASPYFGLPWRNHALGVALGFGIFIGVQTTAAAMRAYAGLVSPDAMNLVKMVSYNCAALVWLTTFLARQPAKAPLPAPQTLEIRDWNNALLHLFRR